MTEPVQIIVPGLVNFRQLGGYPAADGKFVRSGVFYRGAVLYDLTPEQVGLVDALGLKAVLDLRSGGEVAQRPEQMPQGARYHHHSGIASMEQQGGEANLDMKSLVMGAAQTPEALEQLTGYLQRSYKEMALHPAAFATAMQLLLEQNGTPLFFHCTAGKDRTGMCAACILLVLGASRETIMQDYMRSNPHRQQEVAQVMQQVSGYTQDAALLAAVEGMLTVKPAYLNQVFDVIDTHYGSDAAFIEKALGLSQQNVVELRRRYLTE